MANSPCRVICTEMPACHLGDPVLNYMSRSMKIGDSKPAARLLSLQCASRRKSRASVFRTAFGDTSIMLAQQPRLHAPPAILAMLDG